MSDVVLHITYCMIAIIDYGMGNLRSVHKAFEAVGHRAVVTRDSNTIRGATHVVLPGVGAFADCMANLHHYDLVAPLTSGIRSGKPFLGICLGLQLLFRESTEFGHTPGLNIIQGTVVKFSPPASPRHVEGHATPGAAFKIPHMGWNEITMQGRGTPAPLQGISSGAYVYFVHSYYVVPDDSAVVATTSDHGTSFASSIWMDNIFACQFHPEKSQAVGLEIIKNFGEWKA